MASRTAQPPPWVAAKRAVTATRAAALPLLHLLRPLHYTDAAPYKVIDVPTATITHLQQRWHGPIDLPWMETGRWARHASLLRRWHAGIVLDGAWDDAVVRLDDHHLHHVLSQRFCEGLPWADICYVRRALAKARRGVPAWGGRCRSAADVHERCAEIDRLHAQLQTTGYGRLTPAGEARAVGAFTHFMVNIGRDGRIIRNNDGKHRIILARILGIPTLQARVLVRHREWQRVRLDIRRGRGQHHLERHGGHPDLADLVGA